MGEKTEVAKSGKTENKPDFYEIVAKIAAFCDEIDRNVMEGKK